MSGAAIIITQAAIQRARREREEREQKEQIEVEPIKQRGCGVYCLECGLKIEGESKMKVENDHIAFFHPDCYPVEKENPISDETQKALAKALIKLAQKLGIFFNGDEPGGLVK